MVGFRRAGWRLIFEPAAVVIHQGAHGSRQRWSDLEKLRLQTKAYLKFLNQAVPRRRVIANLLASSGLLKIQKTIRKIHKRSAEEVELLLKLHVEELKRQLRNGRI